MAVFYVINNKSVIWESLDADSGLKCFFNFKIFQVTINQAIESNQY